MEGHHMRTRTRGFTSSQWPPPRLTVRRAFSSYLLDPSQEQEEQYHRPNPRAEAVFEATADLQPFHLEHDQSWQEVVQTYDAFGSRARPHSATEAITTLRKFLDEEDWPSREYVEHGLMDHCQISHHKLRELFHHYRRCVTSSSGSECSVASSSVSCSSSSRSSCSSSESLS